MNRESESSPVRKPRTNGLWITTALYVLTVLLEGCQRNEAIPAPVSAEAQRTSAPVDRERLENADKDHANWLSTGRTYDEQRYSRLTQINEENVSQLKLSWHHDLDAAHGAQQSTPLVVDGVMYVTTTWSKVVALDARSGRLLWQFDPKVPGAWGINACCGPSNRGVAVWKGRVFLGTLDGRLIAIDATSGKPIWETLTVDRTHRYSITGAPRVIKDKVLIGNAGSDLGVRGHVAAYDAETGKLLWRFYTVPGNPAEPFENPAMAMAAETWQGEWWKAGGGGTVWDAMAYDPEHDLLYIGTGNGAPLGHTQRSPGGGDNLFISSIVALRPDTGEYVWHFQTVPGDEWGYDAANHLILADLHINGVERQVLMQAPKNGVFYVLDRVTGEFISASPYVPINWASGFDPKTGRPIENPQARYSKSGKQFFARPGIFGARSWQPMSYSPQTGLVYIPAMEIETRYSVQKAEGRGQLAFNIGIDFLVASSLESNAKAATVGHLIAWDPQAQEEVWHVQYEEPWNGGVLSTAGNLVFQGTATGHLNAYDARTGVRLWSAPTRSGIVAAPISYEVEGEQFVAVVTGWGGAFADWAGEFARDMHAPSNSPRVLAFSLKGTDSLPEPSAPEDRPIRVPEHTAPAATVAVGRKLFHLYCSNCHGAAAVSGGSVPDLRYSAALEDFNKWQRIVHAGELQSRGMVGFAAELSREDVEAIRGYVITRARELVEQKQLSQTSSNQ